MATSAPMGRTKRVPGAGGACRGGCGILAAPAAPACWGAETGKPAVLEAVGSGEGEVAGEGLVGKAMARRTAAADLSDCGVVLGSLLAGGGERGAPSFDGALIWPSGRFSERG